jgi:hypothetical protein
VTALKYVIRKGAPSSDNYQEMRTELFWPLMMMSFDARDTVWTGL